MSHVGCRLMVASRANTSRPRAPAACGDIARALATKAAISTEAEGFASGKSADSALRVRATSEADFGLVGSTDISARSFSKPYVGRDTPAVNARQRRRWFRSAECGGVSSEPRRKARRARRARPDRHRSSEARFWL